MAQRKYVLGLDLGVSSIGWSLIERGPDGTPAGIIDVGSHLFEAGVQGNVEDGKDESRAVARREARLMRRQIWRRARRKRKTLRALQRLGMIPAGATDTGEEIDTLLKGLDAQLRGTWETDGNHVEAQMLPYLLRAAATSKPLKTEEVGRALYHLAQRRGFESNRKAPRRDEDDGVVAKGISELESKMQAAGCSTLGSYLATLDPTETRIRGRWTARDMYKKEFSSIWDTQAEHHAAMTDDAKTVVYKAIFDQRPLRSQKHLVGKCELVPGDRRAPVALRISQRFRLLQKVNDLVIEELDGRSRPLKREERDKLIDALQTQGDVSFTKIRSKSLLGLPRGTTFNFEDGGEKRLVGNRVDARLGKMFGNRWDELNERERDLVVEDVLTFEKTDAIERRGRKRWGLDAEQAKAFGEVQLEEGYAAHSVRALCTLVMRMEEGTPYATARKEEFPGSFEATEPVDHLPPVLDAVEELRNPTVERALTELRKVINAIIRRHGKPDRIHIELARDLKRSRKLRKRQSSDNRARQNAREKAKERIVRELGEQEPRRSAVEKVLLADECGWVCPYTGKQICMQTLLGRNPQFDVEHIWPYSRSLDNTFLNKTLCYHEENRSRKRNRTPFEAYSQIPEEWDEMLVRIRSFKSDAARIKMERFRAEEIPDGFTERHLAETRYISVLAAEYVALLFGGLVDSSGKRRVQISTGGLTSHLRREWHLEGMLGGEGKNRDDHRHHAIDALVVGIASVKNVQDVMKAAAQAEASERGRLHAPIDLPWDGFVENVGEVLDGIHVSYRQERRVSGPLHAESLYSNEIQAGGAVERRIRKELHKLSVSEVQRISDNAVRAAVAAKLAELGGPPSKAFADPSNHPRLKTRDGREVPIHKVRIQARVNPRKIGAGDGVRFVGSTKGSNHHTVIWAKLDKDGKEIGWEDEPVTLFEAYERVRRGEPVVCRDGGEGRVFKFSLAANEFVELDSEDGGRMVYRLLSISDGDMEVRMHRDCRIRKELRAAKELERVSGNALLKRNARKIHVSHLGEIKDAGG